MLAVLLGSRVSACGTESTFGGTARSHYVHRCAHGSKDSVSCLASHAFVPMDGGEAAAQPFDRLSLREAGISDPLPADPRGAQGVIHGGSAI